MTTDEIKLPRHLEAKEEKDPITVPIDALPDRTYTADQITQLASAGGIVLDGSRVKALHDVGCAAEQLGIIRTYTGGIVVTLNGLIAGIAAATKVVEDDTEKYSSKEKNEAARVLGYLADKLSKLTSGAVKMNRDVAEVVMERDSRKRASFAPGQKVTINVSTTPTIQ